MGKIKSKAIKKSAKILMGRGVKFTEDFEKNKNILRDINLSKKQRNQMAGLLSRLEKQANAKKIKKEI